MVVARDQGVGNFSKGYKLLVLRWISSEDLIYDMETKGNNTVLYTWNLLRD